MMRKYLLMLIMLLGLISCGTAQPSGLSATHTPTLEPTRNATGVLLKTPEYQGVIVDSSLAPTFAAVDDPTKVNYWQPTSADIAKLEAALPAFLQTTAPEIAQKLTTYARQYVGIETTGQRNIQINAVCNDYKGGDWQREPISVKGGGDCFFHLDYAVDAGTFDQLRINSKR